MEQSLFSPFQLGDVLVKNRIAMAPLTRRRAGNPDLAPTSLMATYYSQRSGAGLIVSEGSQVSAQAYGYTSTPGCYTDIQTDAWKEVTRSIHQHNGRIFLQLWHTGPFSHRLLQPGGKQPLSASEVKPEGEVLTPSGRLPYETSSAMSLTDIQRTTDDFRKAAANAQKAGFDGVEIHAAHAYLIDQFIMDATNRRTDRYGGSISNRARFFFEVLDAVLKEVPPGRVGIRLSPDRNKGGMMDSDHKKTYGFIVQELNHYKPAYLHLSEPLSMEERLQGVSETLAYYRDKFYGPLISCGGYGHESAARVVKEGLADMIAFGRPYISNPDLVERLRKGIPFAEADPDTFYHGGEKGYTDYPFAT